MYFRYKPLSRSFASIKGLSATIGKFYAYTSIPFRTLVTVHFTSPASSCTLTLNSIALVHLWQPAATYRYLSLSTLHFHTYTRSLVCFEKLRKTIYQNLTVHSWFRTFQGIYFSPHHWTQYIYEFSSNDGALCALDTKVSLLLLNERAKNTRECIRAGEPYGTRPLQPVSICSQFNGGLFWSLFQRGRELKKTRNLKPAKSDESEWLKKSSFFF